MTDGNGVKAPESADKGLGDIVGDISGKASLLIQEEIELAKAEVTQKLTRLGKGAAAGAVAAVFLVFMLIYLLHALSYLFFDILYTEPSDNVWLGYLITTGILLLFAAIGGLLALRFIKKGSPPVPELAIEEAKKTRHSIEEVRR
jgi:uncharacterized membrane protein YqjE